MPNYKTENQTAIEIFAHKYYPNHSLEITDETDSSCRYDAIIRDKNNKIVAIVESKARPDLDSRYDHILQDFDKLQILISLAAQFNCAAYIIHYYMRDQLLYTYQLRDSIGNVNILGTVTYELMRKNNASFEKVMKVTSRIKKKDCNKVFCAAQIKSLAA
jgi:hypothetical protein